MSTIKAGEYCDSVYLFLHKTLKLFFDGIFIKLKRHVTVKQHGNTFLLLSALLHNI